VAFHLDKLVAEGLLEVTFARRTGRAGPGAGRPAKLFRRAGREVSVSLPERRYELAAHVLAAALESGRAPAERARAVGAELGAGAVDARSLLERHGFEPDGDGAGLVLRNCPFHALAQAHRELVCGMTLGLVEGMLAGLGEDGLVACPDPEPGGCCVRVHAPS
jgi:predicted ArsR family transcriptional regulator